MMNAPDMLDSGWLRAFFLLVIGGTSVLSADAEDKNSITQSRRVSLAEAHKGTPAIDLKIMNQFVIQPRETQDFYAACRESLGNESLGNESSDEELAKVCRQFKRNTLGGPMLGQVTGRSVAIWMHLPEPGMVRVNVTPERGGSSKAFSSDSPNRIFSVHCTGLTPDTGYTYEVIDRSEKTIGKGRFVTAPDEISQKPFRIAFGSDFHKIGLHRPELMRLIQERGNHAMLLLGDNAADDRENDVPLLKADYLLRNVSPPWQRFAANVPIYASWDDHDYFNNDRFGAFAAGRKSIEVDTLRQIWNQQWNNPGRDAERDGIYFQTRIGPVQIILLDTRSCRERDRQGQLNSFLGVTQMNWLKQQLKESTAPYILLTSGTMWNDQISESKDSWGLWDRPGREEIYRLIDEKEKTQVILLSGDRHGARGFALPRPENRKIYEFEAGTLGGVPGPNGYGPNKANQLFGYPGRTWAFGEFTLVLNGDVAEVTFRLINEDGEELESIVLDQPQGPTP